MELLEQTYLIYQLNPLPKTSTKRSRSKKTVLHRHWVTEQVLAGNQLSSGQLFENAIAAQLHPLGELQYYQRKSGQEIDFIFKGSTALEVKENPLEQEKNTLRQRAASIDISKHLLVGCSAASNGFRDFV